MSTSPSRVVLITGAAGGLGQALTAEFAAQGWRVVAAGHQRPALPETDSVWPVELDVTQATQVDEVVAAVLHRWQRLDALINNAGCIADHALWQMPPADWDSVLSVNLKGAFLCSQAAARAMVRQRDGQIISIGSHSGRVGARGQTNYAAAKAALLGLTTSLARELGPDNVRANVVLPGVLPTPLTAGLSPAQLEALAQANSLRRLNSPDEVARFVVFLAGLRNVSGQLFQLDSRPARWT